MHVLGAARAGSHGAGATLRNEVGVREYDQRESTMANSTMPSRASRRFMEVDLFRQRLWQKNQSRRASVVHRIEDSALEFCESGRVAGLPTVKIRRISRVVLQFLVEFLCINDGSIIDILK
jgi:hypothetical protein